MRWNAVLCSVEEDKGLLCLEHDNTLIRIPLRYLPEGCRAGDVLEIDISFSPFRTLSRMQNTANGK